MTVVKKKPTHAELFKLLRDRGMSRIVDKIELLWGEAVLDEYLSSLIISDRQDRAGFEPEIFDAILALYNLHTIDMEIPTSTIAHKRGFS